MDTHAPNPVVAVELQSSTGEYGKYPTVVVTEEPQQSMGGGHKRGVSGGENGESTDGETRENDKRPECPRTYQSRNAMAVAALCGSG